MLLQWKFCWCINTQSCQKITLPYFTSLHFTIWQELMHTASACVACIYDKRWTVNYMRQCQFVSKPDSKFVNAGWYDFRFNGLTLSNYALQSFMQLIVLVHSFIKFPRTTKAHSMHNIPVQLLHLDRGMVTSWPQVITVVVELLEEVKGAGNHKIKDKFRN
jgi:hypothetical protein